MVWAWRIASIVFRFNAENIPVLIFTIIASLIVAQFDFLGLKHEYGEGTGVGIYIVLGLTLWYSISQIFINSILRKNIKITGRRHNESARKDFIGFSDYAALDVTPPLYFAITDCYMVINKALFIFDEQGVLPSLTLPQLQIIEKNHVGKRLFCEDKYARIGCEVDIDGAETKTFFVVQINFGTRLTKVVTNPKNAFKQVNTKEVAKQIRNFEFTKCDNLAIMEDSRLGLYEVSVALHWKLDKRKMKPIIYDGYVFSTMIQNDDGGIDTITFIRSGDWKQDKDIPKLIERRNKNEEPKKLENGKEKRRKRKKLSLRKTS